MLISTSFFTSLITAYKLMLVELTAVQPCVPRTPCSFSLWRDYSLSNAFPLLTLYQNLSCRHYSTFRECIIFNTQCSVKYSMQNGLFSVTVLKALSYAVDAVVINTTPASVQIFIKCFSVVDVLPIRKLRHFAAFKQCIIFNAVLNIQCRNN